MKLRALLKKGIFLATGAALAAALSGCMFVASPEDLYSLPKLPEEYTDLEAEIAGFVSRGYEFAAPTGGENIQLVQMVDLDSDGADEALLFLRKNGDAKPLKIYIFEHTDEGYQTAAEIQESAASISRVDYRDMNGDGIQELIVGWRIMGDDSKDPLDGERVLSRVVSVYNLDRYDGEKLLETGYHRYITTDLDKNGLPELVVISGGMEGNCSAAMYQWNQGVLEQMSTAKLSVPPAMLDEVRVGGLTDGGDALFVTGSLDEEHLVTDLLVMKGEKMVNCTLDEQTGISRLLYRNSSIPARDINSDGILEIPISYELPKTDDESPTYWGLQWTAFSAKGAPEVVGSTYHNLTDGWYLVLPESWKDTIMITGVASTTGERSVTFGVYRGASRPPQDILTIYTETGDSREYKASRGNRFVLLRQTATIYVAEFAEGSEDWSGTMSRDALKDGFHMIRSEWYLK